MNMPVEMRMSTDSLQSLFNNQKSAYQLAPAPSAKHRITQLAALKEALLSYQDELVVALNKDYGQR